MTKKFNFSDKNPQSESTLLDLKVIANPNLG